MTGRAGSRRALAVLLAVLASGCGSANESRVQFGVHGNEDILRPLLTITATSGDWNLVVRGEEIRSSGTPNYTEHFETPRQGTLRVEAVLARPGEAPLASGAIELEIRADWSWGVTVFLADRNPADTCFGCLGSEAFPVPAELTPAAADSLWLVWGGNSISDPVVY